MDVPDDLLTRLRARHHAYTGPLGVNWWKLTRDAVGGWGGFRIAVTSAGATWWGEGSYETMALGATDKIDQSYLVRYPRERIDQYARRVEVTIYLNFVAPILREYDGHLWRRTPQRETTGPEVTRWWANCDGQGHDADEWMRTGAKLGQRFGWALALFDRTPGDQPASTAATFARWLQPEEVADWQIADDGTFDWIRFVSVKVERDPFTAEEKKTESYTTWTRTAWEVVDLVSVDGKPPQIAAPPTQVPHGLGRVPVAVLYWDEPLEPGKLYGRSQADGAVALALELFNLHSELREWERGQNFGILCVQSNDESALSNIKLGIHNGIRVEPEMAMPAFVTPPEAVGLHLMQRIDATITAIFDQANLERPSADAGGPQSGIARAYKFQQTRAALAGFAGNLQRFEYEALCILAAWQKEAKRDAYVSVSRVQYPTDFDVTDLVTELEKHFTILTNQAVLTPEIARVARLRIGRLTNTQATPDEELALLDQVQRRFLAETVSFNVQFDPKTGVATAPTPPASPPDAMAAAHAQAVATLPPLTSAHPVGTAGDINVGGTTPADAEA